MFVCTYIYNQTNKQITNLPIWFFSNGSSSSFMLASRRMSVHILKIEKIDVHLSQMNNNTDIKIPLVIHKMAPTSLKLLWKQSIEIKKMQTSFLQIIQTLCMEAPKLPKVFKISKSSLRLYVCPVTMYALSKPAIFVTSSSSLSTWSVEL